MALEDIIEKIIKDAEASSSEIKNNAISESKEILSQANSEAESLKKGVLEENQKRKSREIGRIMVKANLERKNRLLRARRSLVEECFKRSEEVFLNSDKTILRDTLGGTILESVKEGIKEVIVSERYRGIITEEFLKNINSELKLSVDPQNIDTFILKGKSVEIDNSISATLKSLKRDIEPDVARILFCSAL